MVVVLPWLPWIIKLIKSSPVKGFSDFSNIRGGPFLLGGGVEVWTPLEKKQIGLLKKNLNSMFM